MLLLQLEHTMAEGIHDGIVTMGETLVPCCLYGEIMVSRH
jgi:hypothetical protein